MLNLGFAARNVLENNSKNRILVGEYLFFSVVLSPIKEETFIR
jgi:hypothetical protein